MMTAAECIERLEALTAAGAVVMFDRAEESRESPVRAEVVKPRVSGTGCDDVEAYGTSIPSALTVAIEKATNAGWLNLSGE